MFIEHEPQNAIQAPSGAAWFELSAWLHRGFFDGAFLFHTFRLPSTRGACKPQGA